MKIVWDETYDVVIVGSGAAGLTAAVTASILNLKPIVIEKASLWGGTSAISGGGVWIPNNDLMIKDGDQDSINDAMTYLKAVLIDDVQASSVDRRLAFLHNGPEMARMLAKEGFRWSRARRYPDYYPERPGARRGRIIESAAFDGNKLGPWLATLRGGGRPFSASMAEIFYLPLMYRTLLGFLHTVHVVGRGVVWRALGRTVLSPGGRALVSQLMCIVQARKVPVELNTTLSELVVDRGRVVGVCVKRAGAVRRIGANTAVLLCAGGYARNGALRQKYQDVGDKWSAASVDDQGDALEIAAATGASCALMEHASWAPVLLLPGNARGIVMWERALPGSIIVDQSGRRFVNEAGSYVDVAHAMLNRHRAVPAIPSWLIFDGRHRRRYLFSAVRPGQTPKALLDEGVLLRAESIDALAQKCNIDVHGLQQTIDRFNSSAALGVDRDFHRGESAYDRFMGGDPRVKPNPNLGPIDSAPYYAAALYPGDLGTKGGLLTDDLARVLGQDGVPIPGLYAAGTTTASVMGSGYPGPGITLGPAMTFAFIAARHAAASVKTLPGRSTGTGGIEDDRSLSNPTVTTE